MLIRLSLLWSRCTCDPMILPLTPRYSKLQILEAKWKHLFISRYLIHLLDFGILDSLLFCILTYVSKPYISNFMNTRPRRYTFGYFGYTKNLKTACLKADVVSKRVTKQCERQCTAATAALLIYYSGNAQQYTTLKYSHSIPISNGHRILLQGLG